MAKAGNKQLGNAKKAKKDEFYTQLADINNTCYAGSPVAGRQLELFGDEPEATKEEKKRIPHKIVINEVTDVNGDGRIDLADVEWLIKNDKNVLTKLEGNGDFRSASSPTRRSAPHMSGRAESARTAAGISTSRRCTATTSCHGLREVTPHQTTFRCCAARATSRRATSKERRR